MGGHLNAVATCAAIGCTATLLHGRSATAADQASTAPSPSTSRPSSSSPACRVIDLTALRRSACSTYDDVRSRTEQIAELTRRRIMPPWKAEPGHGEFIGERRLTDAQIHVFEAWAAGGAIHGDPVPASITGVDQRMAARRARYRARNGTIDPASRGQRPLSELRTADRHPPNAKHHGVAVLPGNSHAVQHATMQFDASGESRRLDQLDPEPGYEGLIPHTVQSPDGYFLGWTPGQMTYVAPAGMAWPLHPGTDLVMLLRPACYGPSGASEDRLVCECPRAVAYPLDDQADAAGSRYSGRGCKLSGRRFVPRRRGRRYLRGAAAPPPSRTTH